MSARVETSRAGDRVVHHLFDEDSGASASILPSYGFNLFDLRLPLAGVVRPIVVSEEDWASQPSRPARNGFPILFPYAGRIRNAHFHYNGRDYALPVNKPPHAIHGFAYDAPWDVLEHSVGPEGSTILGRFQISKNAPEALDRWPSDAALEVRYTLAGRRLEMSVKVENPSEQPLPWAFGLHSYFALPLDRREDPELTRLAVPANRFWVLEDSLPTGETRPVEGTALDFRGGISMKGLQADLALTDLSWEAGDWGVCTLRDEKLGAEFRLLFDKLTRQFVIFTPPGSPGVVAVEPYTAMADPFSLIAMDADPGLQELAPGGTATLRLRFESSG